MPSGPLWVLLRVQQIVFNTLGAVPGGLHVDIVVDIVGNTMGATPCVLAFVCNALSTTRGPYEAQGAIRAIWGTFVVNSLCAALRVGKKRHL